MLQQQEVSLVAPSDVAARTDPYGPIRAAVDTVLERFVDDRLVELAAVDRALVGIAAHLRTLVAGGKRVRPAFVYWGFRAGGRADDPLVVPVAAAVEMLHAFALLHDDVMDHARRRRGRPSAQQVFAGMHRRDGLGGDADWFGVSAAILAGDLAFVWADQLLDAAPLPPGALRGVRERYATLRTEVMTGQYLDLRLDRRPSVTEDEAGAWPCSSQGATPSHGRSSSAWPWPATPGRPARCESTATCSAWRSRSATTCSACSATATAPARTMPTTCAPASAPCSCCAPSPSARRWSAPSSSTTSTPRS